MYNFGTTIIKKNTRNNTSFGVNLIRNIPVKLLYYESYIPLIICDQCTKL